MQDLQTTRTGRRSGLGCAGVVIVLALAVGRCGSISDPLSGKDSLNMSVPAFQSRIMELANCPSPLERLGIDRVRPKIMIGQDGETDLVIPAAADSEGSMVRFSLDPVEGSGGSQIRVSWKVRVSDSASELDMGEDRLLNPAGLARELAVAVESYVSTTSYVMRPNVGNSASAYRGELARTCKKIGRVIDGIAVVTNPSLRTTIEKQKRRDALGWLFKDNYRLNTSAPAGDYSGFYD